MKIRTIQPEHTKLIRSAVIALAGILFFVVMRYIFPDTDLTELQVAFVTVVGSWVFNLFRESIRLS